jgi:hypothetical protein
MNNEVVHLKLEYNEALDGKKDMLSSEINILQLLKIIKRYHIIRNQELNKKIEIQKKVKELKGNLELLTKLMPKPKMPKSTQKKNERSQEAQLTYEKHSSPLEEELREIQRKLKELE